MKNKQPVKPVRNVMGVKDVVAYLGISETKVYSLAKRRQIPCCRIGIQYKFLRELLDEWMKARVINKKCDTSLSVG
jgi:excisionase family DNA binding protein